MDKFEFKEVKDRNICPNCGKMLVKDYKHFRTYICENGCKKVFREVEVTKLVEELCNEKGSSESEESRV